MRGPPRGSGAMQARNEEVRKRVAAGAPMTSVAKEFGINRQRVSQIVHPERRRVYDAVQRALKSGALVRPEECVACGGGGPISAHHDDYDKPLDVRWLCHPCHIAADHTRRRRDDGRWSLVEVAGKMGVCTRHAQSVLVGVPFVRIGRVRRYLPDDVRAAFLEHRAPRSAFATHCPRGHALFPENVRVERNGVRSCLACTAAAVARSTGCVGDAKMYDLKMAVRAAGWSISGFTTCRIDATRSDGSTLRVTRRAGAVVWYVRVASGGCEKFLARGVDPDSAIRIIRATAHGIEKVA